MLRKIRGNKTPPKPRVYAFIDNQNLNLGVQKVGWKMNWRRFREFLAEEYGVTQAFMFIGYMQEHEDLYKQMYDSGYNVILKPTVGMFETDKDDEHQTKGNVDVDLVLEAMKQWNKYDKAVIVSGDGDFFALVEHLQQKGKLSHVLVPNWKYSTLLKQFDDHVVRLDQLRKTLEYHDHKKKRRPTNQNGAEKGQNHRSKPKKPS